MSIEVLTAPPNRLLTTLNSIKGNLQVPFDDHSEDDLLKDLIAAASDFCHSYTGRIFARQTVRESVEATGIPNVLVTITPIVEVTLVEFGETPYTDYTILDKDAGILQRQGRWTSTQFGFGTISPHPSSFARKDWHITYRGGYVLPGWPSDQGARNLPYDLERACIDVVRAWFHKRKFDPSWSSYRIGETQIAWKQDTQEMGVPTSALSVLNFYRRAF